MTEFSKGVWLEKVDVEMRSTYRLTPEDLGWSQGDIDSYFETGWEPRKFVAWYGAKYDLVVANSS